MAVAAAASAMMMMMMMMMTLVVGRRRRGHGGIIDKPLTKKTYGQPVEVGSRGRDGFAAGCGQTESKQAALDAGNHFIQLIDLVLDKIEHDIRQGGAKAALTDRPLTDDMNQSLLEYDPAAGEEA